MEDEPGVTVERRGDKRRKSRVNRLVRARIHSEDVDFDTFLFLVDISLGGMRINVDRLFAPESRIRIEFPLEPYLRTQESLRAVCHVAWSRQLVGGTYVHGLEFKEIDPSVRELISRLFETFSPEGKRERFRLNRVLSVAYSTGGDWIPWSACDLSCEGFGMQMHQPLELDQLLQIKLYLEEDGDKYSALQLEGQVVYAAEMDDDIHRLGIKFVDITEADARRIKAYMDRRV